MEDRDRLLEELREAQEASDTRSLGGEVLDDLALRHGLSRAEVRGVAGYYSMLSLEPRGRHLIRVCVSPVCRMLGSEDLLGLLERELGVEAGGTTADGLVTLETCQCLGQCAGAPAMELDDRVLLRLTGDSVRSTVAALRRGEHPDAE